MTYPSEKEGVIITDRDEFFKKFCETCKWQDICFEWSLKTGVTLYANKTSKGEFFVADDGTEGVFRCSSYEMFYIIHEEGTFSHVEEVKK